MTNKELELKKSQQYKHLKENVEKVFGTKSDEFISSVMGMILKTIYYRPSTEPFLTEHAIFLDKNDVSKT